jgi:hypothetical protein
MGGVVDMRLTSGTKARGIITTRGGSKENKCPVVV